MLLLAPPMAKPPLQNLPPQQKRNFAIIRMATVGFCWHSKAILVGRWEEEGGGKDILFFLLFFFFPYTPT